jgi:hypothetical protein
MAKLRSAMRPLLGGGAMEPVNEEALGRIPTTVDQIHPIAGAGSVTADDGSTISWTTAADGTITATGSDGREMTINGVPGTVAGAGVAFAFANEPAAPYLTLSRTLTADSFTVAVAAGPETVSVTVTTSATGSSTANVSGVHGGKPFQWSGPVNLAGNPQSQLAAVSGYDPAAFAAPFTQTEYFAPACQALVNQPTATPPPGRLGVAHESVAGDIVAAAGWGLGAAGAAILALPAGATIGAGALIGIFATGAGAWAVDNFAGDIADGIAAGADFLAAPIDVDALIEQIQNQQAVGPGSLPDPVETVTGPGGEQVGPPDDSDDDSGGGGGGSGEGPDDKPGLQPD